MNSKAIFSLIIVLLGAGLLSAQKSYDALVFEGNQSFDKKKYDDATAKYADAIQKNPKDFTAHYNLGNSLYKSEKYKEAQAEFEKANQLARSIPDKSAALHNLGNAHMKMKEPEKAAEFYKQSLKNDPYNEATRKNYEIAKLEEKQKEEQQKKGKSGEGKDDKNKGEDGKDDGDKKSSQPNGKGEENKGEGAEGNKKKDENDGKMPKDLQDAILNRATNKEQETARRILNKNSYSMPQSNEKDW